MRDFMFEEVEAVEMLNLPGHFTEICLDDGSNPYIITLQPNP